LDYVNILLGTIHHNQNKVSSTKKKYYQIKQENKIQKAKTQPSSTNLYHRIKTPQLCN